MSYRPADFFLSVIDVFGILVPGAVFLLLELDFVQCIYPLPPSPASGIPDWVLATLAAYVLGHLLFAVGVCLNYVYDWPLRLLWPKWIKLDRELTSARLNRAFSYVRLHGPDVIGEVERQAGAYKLFRTLTVVFLADAMISRFVEGRPPPWRIAAALVLALVCLLRFGYLKKWTTYLALEFEELVGKSRREDAAQQTSNS